jgi:hypothetical protein
LSEPDVIEYCHPNGSPMMFCSGAQPLTVTTPPTFALLVLNCIVSQGLPFTQRFGFGAFRVMVACASAWLYAQPEIAPMHCTPTWY